MKIEYATYLSNKNKSPKKVLELIDSGSVGDILSVIYSRYGITNQKTFCTQVVGYTLIGLVPIKRFIQALQEDAGLDESTAKNIAHDVRAEIFAPVAKELAAMQEEAERQWTTTHETHGMKHETETPSPTSRDEVEAGGQETSNPQDINFEQEKEKTPAPDESVVREVFPAPEVDEKKFDDGLEKPEEKEGDKDERF